MVFLVSGLPLGCMTLVLMTMFVSALPLCTTLIMKSVQAVHRVWDNKAAKHVLELEAANAVPQELFNAACTFSEKLIIFREFNIL